MNLAFSGFRHSHIYGLYTSAQKSERVNITGCFEENEPARISASEALGGEFNYNSFDELIGDDAVDAVPIGDCYGKRGNLAIEELKAGKNIILDKPICTSLEDLAEIERISNEKNLKVCWMLDLRYMLPAIKAKEIVDSGELGEVKTASFTGQHSLSYGSRPMWYFEEGMHGGTINDIAIHGIDLVRFITGKSLTRVEWARCWNAYADKEPQFKDSAQFAARFEDLSLISDVSYAAPGFKGILPTYWDFCFWGTKGLIKFNYGERNLHIYKEEEEIIEFPETQPGYLEHFCDEIEGKTTIMTTESVIASARDTLTIQKFADEN